MLMTNLMRRHPCLRTSIAYLTALLITGGLTIALYLKESCYEPCDSIGNTVKTIFGFWDPSTVPDIECKIPGVASRICIWEQIDPYFYLAFDALAVVVLLYAINGIRFLVPMVFAKK